MLQPKILVPIRTINFSDPTDKAQHDQLVELVERMLALHKRLAAARVPHEKTMLQQQITMTNQHIVRMVYELYGLTERRLRWWRGRSKRDNLQNLRHIARIYESMVDWQ